MESSVPSAKSWTISQGFTIQSPMPGKEQTSSKNLEDSDAELLVGCILFQLTK